jgi:hypothetical protein
LCHYERAVKTGRREARELVARSTGMTADQLMRHGSGRGGRGRESGSGDDCEGDDDDDVDNNSDDYYIDVE